MPAAFYRASRFTGCRIAAGLWQPAGGVSVAVAADGRLAFAEMDDKGAFGIVVMRPDADTARKIGWILCGYLGGQWLIFIVVDCANLDIGFIAAYKAEQYFLIFF